MTSRLFFALLLLAAPALADPITVGDLRLDGASAFATPPTARAAGGYVTITNTGEEDDRLIGVSATFAVTQIHQTETDSAGVARMIHQEDGIPIPAGETVVLEPGGLHVMFMGLTAPFVAGEPRTATLVFEKAGEVEVSFEVVPR